MIKLRKIRLPKFLRDRLTDLLQAYRAAEQVQSTASHYLQQSYNQPEVKEILQEDSNYKCAYCENCFNVEQASDIDHFIPKYLGAEHRFDWDNMISACRDCNNYKGRYYDEHYSLLNPYIDDPEEHLYWNNTRLKEEYCSGRGKLTVRTLRLNRKSLHRARVATIDDLETDICNYSMTADPYVKERLLEQIWERADDYSPFAGMIRSKLLFDADIPLQLPGHPRDYASIVECTLHGRAVLREEEIDH